MSREKFPQLHEALLEARPELKREWEASLPKRKMALALVRLRKHAGLTQAELAAKAGWDKGYVSRVESASGGVPDSATIMRYADACGGHAGVVFAIPDAGKLHIVDVVTLSGDPGRASALERLRGTAIESVEDRAVAAAAAAGY